MKKGKKAKPRARTEEVEAALRLEVRLLVRLVHRDAHDLRVELLVLLDVPLEGLGLQGAAWWGGVRGGWMDGGKRLCVMCSLVG